MLKHMLTTKCPRSCEYCITRNINAHECTDLNPIHDMYESMYAKGHREIMLTGGEPTSGQVFPFALIMAKKVFDRVHITTQNKTVINKLSSIYNNFLNTVVYSLHDGLQDEQVLLNIPVYGAILDNMYTPELPYMLQERGFKGLTINEEQRKGETFIHTLPEIRDFSVRINKVGHCMDETIILPDLSVITDFTPYL